MKKHIFGVMVCFSAFVIGYLLVRVSNQPNQVSIATIQNETVLQIDSKSIPEKTIADELESLEVIDDHIEAQGKFKIRLLETGPNFHADQIEAKNGEKWLGLFKEHGNYSLRTTTLKVKNVPDELVHGPSSDQKGKLTGKSVAVNNKIEPIFLLKNSHWLREGSVTTLFEGERENWEDESVKPTFLDKNFRQTYKLAGKSYELKVIKAKNKSGDPILALALENDGIRQLLHTFWMKSEGEYGVKNWLGSVGTLYWVGDLDRDNKPDFYLSFNEHMIVYDAFVLLSSEAEKGRFVKKAAHFSTSGCG